MDLKRNTLTFLAALRDITPPIWRRIEVPASYTFWDLHVAIQDAMPWLDSHLHAFRMRNPLTGVIDEIGIPDGDAFEGEPIALAGWTIPLTAYFTSTHDGALYEYDFGDSWEHDVVLESIGTRHPRTKYPRCLAGARACPPEDCGGAAGYEELLDIMAHPEHEEYESTLEWLGGSFDPEKFDASTVRFDDPKKRWRIAFSGE